METIPPTVILDSVDAYNRLYGLETLHPLVAVIDLKNAKNPVNHIQMNYGVYALYCFYSRQFITRKKVNKGILATFEKELKEYYIHGRGKDGVPTVAYFAANANLTPGYFGDLIKKETGDAPKELISRYIVNLAKERLATTGDDVSIIAYDLGFQYPQHFSRLFKRLTELSPSDYRKRIQSKNG